MGLPRPLLLAACCVLAACEGDEGDTIVLQQTAGASALPGNFPGAPVTAFNVAADGMAFSESGEYATSALRYYPSGVGNRGIVLYDTTDATFSRRTLWAHYFDGSRFTPPVALRGGGQDPASGAGLGGAAVLFLNVPGSARDGDALVLFRRTDLDDGDTGTTAGPNARLYFSYFDQSLAGTAQSGDIRYGFDSTPAPLDPGDDAGVDVQAFGLVSDGLRGAAEWWGPGFGPGEVNAYEQGDPVTLAAVVYTKLAASPPSYARPSYAVFDLTSANSGNSFGTPQALPLDTGAGATDPAQPVFITYDRSVFLTYTQASASDTHLLWNVHGSAASSNGFLTNSIRLNPTDGNINMSGFPGRGRLAGPDEGLVSLLGLFDIAGLGNSANRDLFAFQCSPSAGTFTPATDRVEVDSDPANTGAQPVTLGSAQPVALCALNRTSEWIFASWLQPRAATAGNDGMALWCRAIQTTRSGAPPALGTRVSGTAAQQVDAVATGGTSSPDQVFLWKLQSDIVPGSQGIQSDRYSLHVIWKQDVTASGEDRLRTRKAAFVPSAGSGNPTLTLGTERIEDFRDGELGNNGTPGSPGGFGTVMGLDGGGLGGTAGELVLYFVRNATPSGSTAPDSFRAYQKIGGGTPRAVGSLVSGSGSGKQCFNLVGGGLPHDAAVQSRPDWAGNAHHLLLHEIREDNPGSGLGTRTLRHRMYDKDSTAPAIEDRFVPAVSATSLPAQMDRPIGGHADLSGAEPGLAGGAAGLFFTQGDHLWYNQWDPVARRWYVSGGDPDPQIVDHEGDAPLQAVVGSSQRPVADPSQSLSRLTAFWMKSPYGTPRWYARVRD